MRPAPNDASPRFFRQLLVIRGYLRTRGQGWCDALGGGDRGRGRSGACAGMRRVAGRPRALFFDFSSRGRLLAHARALRAYTRATSAVGLFFCKCCAPPAVWYWRMTGSNLSDSPDLYPCLYHVATQRWRHHFDADYQERERLRESNRRLGGENQRVCSRVDDLAPPPTSLFTRQRKEDAAAAAAPL